MDYKQFRPRSNTTERSVWSGSTVFAIYAAIFDMATGSKIDFFKF